MSAVVTKPLLIELFTEELPPKALQKLSAAFGAGILEQLRLGHFLEPDSQLTIYATPRRLAALITSVRSVSRDTLDRTKIMPVSVGLTPEGRATPKLTKRIRTLFNDSVDVDAIVAECKRELDGKSEVLVYEQPAAGVHLKTTLDLKVENAVESLPIPKRMSYQLLDGVETVEFVRPLRGLAMMHGDEAIEGKVLGIESVRNRDNSEGKNSPVIVLQGHRFQGANNIQLDSAEKYAELLRQHGKVEPVFATRRDMILSQLEAKASELGATLGAPASYADLLDEVNSLVEWPTVYVCQFEAEFLAVPQECLILTMKTNQKYFPLFDQAGKLKNQFLIVSNMELADPKKIVEGNERVVRPRLADARFFFETDKKTRLDARIPDLEKVVYHNKLGTLGKRVTRVSKLAGEIGVMIGADKARAERGALLAKADLLTQMVGEFPELQGTMGRYYALHDGEPDDVAAACAEHYQPRFAGDALPSPGVPTAVALADKLEVLVGLFAVGEIPKGDRDPFALRRHALGVIRMLIESNLPASLRTLLMHSFECVEPFLKEFARNPDGIPYAVVDTEQFIYDRLRGYLKDTGASTNEIESVVANASANFATLPAQLAAVRAFAALPEATSLNAANKRVANILRKAAESGEAITASDAMQEPAEQALRGALDAITPAATALFAQGDFAGYLKSFATLKNPVDEFFDKVMVMAEDKAVRANRLALLRDLRDAMNKVADLSKLAT